jgi:hypothetical protein
MKAAYVFKFIFAIAFGALFGEYITWDYAKWHALGRNAFLASQGNRFDRYMAHPAPGILHIIVATVLIVGLAASYEMAAFVGAKCVSLIRPEKNSATPTF